MHNAPYLLYAFLTRLPFLPRCLLLRSAPPRRPSVLKGSNATSSARPVCALVSPFANHYTFGLVYNTTIHEDDITGKPRSTLATCAPELISAPLYTPAPTVAPRLLQYALSIVYLQQVVVLPL